MTEHEAIRILNEIGMDYAENGEEEYCEALDMAINAFEEIKQLKENGAFTGLELAQIAAMQIKLKEYQAIGTLDVCRIALVKQKPKKPTEQFGEDEPQWSCPICGHWLYADEPYCDRCGQKIDWSDAN